MQPKSCALCFQEYVRETITFSFQLFSVKKIANTIYKFTSFSVDFGSKFSFKCSQNLIAQMNEIHHLDVWTTRDTTILKHINNPAHKYPLLSLSKKSNHLSYLCHLSSS